MQIYCKVQRWLGRIGVMECLQYCLRNKNPYKHERSDFIQAQHLGTVVPGVVDPVRSQRYAPIANVNNELITLYSGKFRPILFSAFWSSYLRKNSKLGLLNYIKDY